MREAIRKVKSLINKVEEGALKLKVIKDVKAGPGLEEAALLVFIGIIVASSADGLGDVVSATFQKTITSLKGTFGITS